MIGAEVAGAVVVDAARDLQPRVAGLGVEPQHQVVLVVDQLDVELGLVLLDQVVFEEQRLFFVAGDDGLDVAEHAQVSLATVDRVFNRRPGVSNKTVQRVEQALAKLGYRRFDEVVGQMQMLDQCEAADFIAADTMDLWINIANERLHDVLKGIDLLVINDGEAKEFAGTTNLVEAGRRLRDKGPKFVIVKRGEHGSYLFGDKKEHFFSCSAYPLHSVFDPTGAGDSFLGGLVGWLAAHGKTKPTFEDLKSAVVHGSVVASYTCEAFSTHKLQTVTPLDVAQRIAELKLYTQFA